MLEQEKESFVYRLTLYFEGKLEPKTLVILFFAGLLGNILSWIVALFLNDNIAAFFSFLLGVSDKFLRYLLIVPFFFSFLSAFSIFKYLLRRKDEPIVSKKEFFNGYSRQLIAENFRRIVLISAMFAGLNTILLVSSVIWFR